MYLSRTHKIVNGQIRGKTINTSFAEGIPLHSHNAQVLGFLVSPKSKWDRKLLKTYRTCIQLSCPECRFPCLGSYLIQTASNIFFIRKPEVPKKNTEKTQRSGVQLSEMDWFFFLCLSLNYYLLRVNTNLKYHIKRTPSDNYPNRSFVRRKAHAWNVRFVISSQQKFNPYQLV